MPEADVREILRTVNERVGDLRRQGHYPVGLEQELEAEFRSIMALTRLTEAGRLGRISTLLAEAEEALHQVRMPPNISSRFILGGLVHRFISRLVGRPMHDVTSRVHALTEPLLQSLELLRAELESRDGVEDHVANALSKHVVERVAVIEHLAILAVNLESRIRAMETDRM